MKKNQKLLFEIVRYLMVGGAATLFDYGAFALFRYVLLEQTLANLFWSTAVGFAVGLTFNYVFSILFVFKNVADPQRGKRISSFLLFAVIGVVGLGITEFGMWLSDITRFFIGSEVYRIPEMLMKVVMTGIVLCWNYIARKLLIFKAPKPSEKETNA